MSRVNLLPPELRHRLAIRRTTSLVVAAALGVLALIGVVFFLQLQRLADTQDELETQQTRNAELQSQIDGLQQFAALQTELAAKQELLSTIFVNEVSWSSALLDVSRVIPDASYLTSLTGQITATSEGEGAEPSGGSPNTTFIGTMTFQGVAQEIDTIATWITQLEQVEGWVNAWVTNAQEDTPSSNIYTFSNGLDLTQDAATARGKGEAP